MNRAATIALAVGVLAALGWLLLAGLGTGAMPSYLAAWLFWLGVPMGALPLAMALEAAGASTKLLAVLRRMLLLLPAAAVFAIPVLLRSGPLFARAELPGALPAWWTAPGLLIPRALVILVVLSLLALVFSRVPRLPRRRLATLGLVLHFALVSLAAVDWVLSVQPGLGSSAIGLVLIAGQVGLAACAAAFVLAVGSAPRVALPGETGLLLALLLAAWGFLHFMQFLVVWSANLPAEVMWYLARSGGLGGGAIGFAAAAVVLGVALLPVLGRWPFVLASLAFTALLAHLVEAFWLVTPAFRGRFAVTLGDGLALLGIGGLLMGLLLVLLPGGRAHARA